MLYKLPDRLKNELREPLGDVIDEDELTSRLPHDATIIAVGDMVAYTLHKRDYKPHLTIIDYHTQRDEIVEFASDLKEIGEVVVEIENPAGEITRELWQAIKDALESEKPVRIEVEGEEDLATIPCVMLAENGAYLVYGLWNRGLVLVEINTATRKRVETALKLMEV
ncbi:MAG: GTP-dependent dephospho-CoA kinase family protein [Thermoplasmata archaeon]|nr:MAG: GTP-dependent dephospho-CoA kinase family protein [Thermoplasmata archaeon]